MQIYDLSLNTTYLILVLRRVCPLVDVNVGEIINDHVPDVRKTILMQKVSPQNFGFIEEVFVEPKLIKENNLTDGQNFTGKAILSFNKKKNEWGWKAIGID